MCGKSYAHDYRSLVDFIARNAPGNSNVAFSGYRDGSFVFAMRTHEERRDLFTIRVDKLLLRVAIKRSLGVQDKGYTAAQIAQMLDRLAVRYVVAQPGFWTDLCSVGEFARRLSQPAFSACRQLPDPGELQCAGKAAAGLPTPRCDSARPDQSCNGHPHHRPHRQWRRRRKELIECRRRSRRTDRQRRGRPPARGLRPDGFGRGRAGIGVFALPMPG